MIKTVQTTLVREDCTESDKKTLGKTLGSVKTRIPIVADSGRDPSKTLRC